MSLRDAPAATAARLAGVRARMAEEGVAGLLVTDLPSVRWLTGFTGSAGRVLVTGSGPALLVTDDRYTLRAAAEAPDASLVVDRTWGWLPEALADVPVLAVEADVMPWGTVTTLQDLMEGTRLVATEGLVRDLRAAKDDGEIALLRRACDITAAAFEAALGWLAPGVTERQVAHRLTAEMVDRGADGPAFPAIVAAGPNGATPHHEPGSRPIAAGDLVTMDFGALVDGYHADMTRTVAVGQPDGLLRRLHDLVRSAQQAGVEAVADGVATAAVDRACREVITDAGHGAHFRHGTGHGVGLQVHEAPFLGVGTPGTLRTRMTVTVEPGVYVPGLGGVRIEDVVLVGTQGAERLTTASHDLITL